MIRFSYDTPDDLDLPFRHFSIEGNNERGYVLLGWNDGEGFGGDDDVMLQQWFETLGEALDFCNGEYFIMRGDWHAPTVKPPLSGQFGRIDRGRRKGESTLLNPDPDKPLDAPKDTPS